MTTERYKELSEGVVDPRNPLNDLTEKDWLLRTKSFFYQKGLGADSPKHRLKNYIPPLIHSRILVTWCAFYKIWDESVRSI